MGCSLLTLSVGDECLEIYEEALQYLSFFFW